MSTESTVLALVNSKEWNIALQLLDDRKKVTDGLVLLRCLTIRDRLWASVAVIADRTACSI